MDALAKVCPKCGRRYDTAAEFCQKDGVRLDETDEKVDPYIGQNLLDQFKIEEKIGAGGMGSVYRARQTTLHRDVAIKILHPELADNRDAVRRFKREARVSTALDHPNVVRVFLFGQLKDGSLYIVMEYLKGRSLLELLRREGALPVHRALHIATQICDGVGEAHSQGVVHRDIKPENVVLVAKTRDPDHVKVLDFGIARVLWGDEQTQATQSGLVFGTARYISPEGAAGEATDARSDVYSLGILCYQLLCGATPFDAPSPVGMLMKHIHSSAPHLRSQSEAQQVPEAIADVVMRALSKHPDGRYDDAHGYADALRKAAESSGFEVHGGRRAHRPSIGPRSEPGIDAATPPVRARKPTPMEPAASPTPAMNPTPAPIVESGTLQGAPSPFDDEDDVAIPGLGKRGGRAISKNVRSTALAFAVGALLVGGAFGIYALVGGEDEPTVEVVDLDALSAQARDALGHERYDEPRDQSVLGITDAILAEDADHTEALRLRREVADRLARRADARARDDEREEARALYQRALLFVEGDETILASLEALDRPEPPAPGVRTRPLVVIEDQEIVLVGVPSEEIGERARPRFVLHRRRRRVGRAIAATLQEDGSYEATHTIARPGTYELIFRIGSGSDRIEERSELTVARDPSRRPRSRDDDDPPPITTQGSSWTPAVAPAWTPTPNPPPPPTPDPPPPPAPWTGSVL